MTPNPAIIIGLGSVIIACLICILWVVVIEVSGPPTRDPELEESEPHDPA